MALLRWIDAGLEQWVRGLCRVPALLDVRPQAAESIAVVVPAREAWPFYLDHNAYICHPGRFFRQISHIGFFAESAVQTEVPKVLEGIDHVAWTPDEIRRRIGTKDEPDRQIAEIIKHSLVRGWTENEYQIFLLTGPDAEAQRRGHVTLKTALP